MAKDIGIKPGDKFGRLTVIERSFDHIDKNSGKHRSQFLCQCDCGKKVIVKGVDLKVGTTKSCGCLQKEMASKRGKANKTYGISNTKIAQAYYNMKQRIHNPNVDSYPQYGGRGIKICPEWDEEKTGIANFYNDMAPTYKDGLWIDRIDPNGDYCPENCRWATEKLQANNRQDTVLLEHDGVTASATEWEHALGYSKDLVRARLKNFGYTQHEALFGKDHGKSKHIPKNAFYFLDDENRPISPDEYERRENCKRAAQSQ